MNALERIVPYSGKLPSTIGKIADGFQPFVLAQLAGDPARPVLFISRDGQNLDDCARTLKFIDPELRVMELPGWDCLPYDRVSPAPGTASRRLAAMAALAETGQEPRRTIVLTSVNAALQKMPPGSIIEQLSFAARPGQILKMNDFASQLGMLSFERVPTVRGVGEFSVRGGILDFFAPGHDEPVRLDFFGDTLETIRVFDPQTQRSSGSLPFFAINPMSEVTLEPETISRFRRNYLELFGAATRDDALYQAVSEGRRFAGMEHWLPLFYEELHTIFDYLADPVVVLDHMVAEAASDRHDQIIDHYEARLAGARSESAFAAGGTLYKPIPPDRLYLSAENLAEIAAQRDCVKLTPFEVSPVPGQYIVSADCRPGRNWASERAQPDINVFDAVVRHIADLTEGGRKVLIAGWSEGSLNRMVQVLGEHGLGGNAPVFSLTGLLDLKPGIVGTAVLRIEHGFETGQFAVIGEQDVLGDRLVRSAVRRKRNSDAFSDVAGLSPGDLVVHVEHGIGQFVQLRTIEAAGAPHDCLELHYADEAKLFLPVENIELLSRFGSQDSQANLDRLGGGAWQARKAKVKKRLLEMAEELIRIAAARQMRGAPVFQPADGLYDEFSARFAYDETEDQQSAIDAVLSDLDQGTPMDRLICGDVGFGKTEVALRAAFVAALNGAQVALVVPTTLLARQHYKTFADRFSGLPVKVRQMSRLVPAKEAALTRAGLIDGTVDIVIGTHALLGASVKFNNLGLLIIDEEQHFGVKHKERLKEMKSDVHVLTLSATPIPRTLQLALTGVRELSLITTAPVDRMAVRTFISPFDALTIRETLLRERYRGGQSFYVVPRIADLGEVRAFLESEVPELKVATAHGQMPPGQLDDVMNAFYDGRFDVLLSTSIVESGLDIPSANTLIVHRADMFGLAQLYQLRGRVGRSKLRAFALFTVPANRMLNPQAERRLKVLQSLDTLGSGFQLASHDLDQRGAGNLLGEQQSGQVREVGYELYQQMLEEAVAEMRGDETAGDGQWSPQITIGMPVMIPETYVPDLQLRMGLYRRLAELTEPADIDAFGAELIDRFGDLPSEVEHLLKVVFIKALCRKANVERLDAGQKGVVVQFRNGEFAEPAALVQHIAGEGSSARIRPDHSVVFIRQWATPERRLSGAAIIAQKLAQLAKAA